MRRPARAAARPRVLTALLAAACGGAAPTAAAPPVPAQTPPPGRASLAEAIDSIARAAVAGAYGAPIPGLSVAVTRRGAVVTRRGYGIANVATGAPADSATVYQVGSITKQLTAAAVMRLVEAGRLSLDDRLAELLPAFPTRGSDIRLRHLLNQTSGIAPVYHTRFRDTGAPVTVAQVVDTIARLPLLAPPGQAWGYNNSAYFLLGAIIERASGTTYPAYLQQTFLAPLGMTATGLCGANGRAVPAGYDAQPGRAPVPVPPVHATIPYSGGGLCATAGDLAAWLGALLGGRAVGAPSLRAMLEPTTLASGARVDYGFGLWSGTSAGRRYVYHDGAIPGFHAQAAAYPDAELVVVVLTNANPTSGPGAPAAAAQLERAIAARALAEP